MSLDDQTLERLIVDLELGELSEDAVELLGAFLRENPARAGIANDIRDTLLLAKASLAPRPVAALESLPQLSFAKLASRGRFGDAARGGFIGFAIAASLALAVWIGYGPKSAGSNQSGGALATVPNTDTSPNRAAGGFWAVSDLRRSIAARRISVEHKIKWTGPISRPRIGASS